MPVFCLRILGSALLAVVPLGASSPAGTPRYIIETVAGSGQAGDGGPALAAQLNYPQGIAVDRNGNVYVADTRNHRVRRITPAGLITTIAGDGQAGMRGDGGPAEFARLKEPYGVAVDAAGNVFIADCGNHRVRRIAPNGIITTVAGTGEKGAQGDRVAGTDAQLMSPRNLALDSSGNLFISEFDGHRVRKLSPSGVITTVAGLGVAGLSGDGGYAASAQLDHPAGLAVESSGVLYIADSQNHRIRRVGLDGRISSYLGGTDAVVFSTPVGLALDSAANLYVVERVPQVRKFSPQGRMWKVAGTGTPGYGGDNGPALTAMLQGPADVAVDNAGNVYIADGPRIRKVVYPGVISTIAGDAFLKSIGDGGPAAQGVLNQPRGLAMNLAGDIFIADTGTQRVRMLSAAGVLSTVAGTGVRSSYGDGVAATSAGLNTPSAVALDTAGGLLIADTGGNRIRQVPAGGNIRAFAGNNGTGLGGDGLPALLMPLHAPLAAIADASGNVLIADTAQNRVLTVNPAGIVTTAAGNASGGYSGDGGRAPLAQLRDPSGLALDGAGNLYIADTGNHVIRKVTAARVISTVAGCGIPGFTGDGGAATAACLNQPRGIAVDGDGNLFIADTGNHAIRKVAGGVIRTIAGTGIAGFDGDGAAAIAAQLNEPWAVLLDGSGNLYVSDSGNHRVRKLTPAADRAPIEMVDEARVVSAASYAPGPVAPGEMAAVYAYAIGPETGVSGTLDASGVLRTEAAGTQVLFDGTPAPLLYVQSDQLIAQVPYNVAGHGLVAVEVYRDRQLRARASVPIVQTVPALFTVSGGTGQAVAVNQDGTFNSEANPAARGSIVTLFATGEGQTGPAGVNGLPAKAPYPAPLLPAGFTIGRYDAEILYAGAAPGLVGVFQINARVPSGFVPTGILGVELSIGASRSQPGVTIAVK